LTSRRRPSATRNLGFSMIEILVALLLISVGFMNIAGLQTAAKKANYASLQRTTAAILGRDVAEKMRANPVALGGYITAAGGVGGGTLSQPGTTCTSASQCNPGQLATYDMWLWEQAIDGANESRTINSAVTNTGGLVNPTACITGPSGGLAGVYVITLVWRGLNELNNVSSDTCGTGAGKYGTNEEFRRILQIRTYISP